MQGVAESQVQCVRSGTGEIASGVPASDPLTVQQGEARIDWPFEVNNFDFCADTAQTDRWPFDVNNFDFCADTAHIDSCSFEMTNFDWRDVPLSFAFDDPPVTATGTPLLY